MSHRKRTFLQQPVMLNIIAGVSIALACAGMVYFIFGDDMRGKTTAEKISENKAQLERLEKKHQKWQTLTQDYSENRQAVKKLLAAQTELKRKKAALLAAERELAAAEAARSKTAQKFTDYKNLYRSIERSAAVGERYQILTTKNGKSYQKVIVRKVAAEGVDIRHQGGGALIEPDLLPDELHDRFQFSEDELQVAKAGAGSNPASQRQVRNTLVGFKGLGESLRPLEKPDLTNAKRVISNLERIVSASRSPEKEAAAKMARAIKGLFTAEYRVTQALKYQDRAEREAREHENNAKDWMESTTFNSKGHPQHARESLLKARKVRLNAAKELKDSRQELRDEMRKMDLYIVSLYEAKELVPTVILSGAIEAMNERSLSRDYFELSISKTAIGNLREFLAHANRWQKAAEQAELAKNYEKAFRLYTRANDMVGRQRCSLALAKELEKQKLYGSACDYYETANDFASAVRIRKAYPELINDSFAQLNSEDLYAKASPCCVRIRTRTTGKRGLGSGFFFKRGGYILTNNHVIKDALEVEVVAGDGRKFSAQVVAQSDTPDLAVLRIGLEQHDILRLGSVESVKIGTPVVLIGYPLVDLATATMNAGMVSNTKRVFSDNPCFQLDVSANHGNSGGPVIDSHGRAIGILTFGLGDMNADRFNFAIRVDVVRKFLRAELGAGFGE